MVCGFRTLVGARAFAPIYAIYHFSLESLRYDEGIHEEIWDSTPSKNLHPYTLGTEVAV